MCVQYLAAALFFEFDFHCVVPPISSLWCTAAAAVSHSFAFLNRGHERLFRQLLLRARPFSLRCVDSTATVQCSLHHNWRLALRSWQRFVRLGVLACPLYAAKRLLSYVGSFTIRFLFETDAYPLAFLNLLIIRVGVRRRCGPGI